MMHAVQGLKGCIPANFPYLHVEFGLAAGFVHVLDDEAAFDPDFARNVMAGLLQSSVEDLGPASSKGGHNAQQAERDMFLEGYKNFDWTQQLE